MTSTSHGEPQERPPKPVGSPAPAVALTPFVGRDRELVVLADRIADVELGRGRVVGILGEPGVGKSRFVFEVTRAALTRRWRVLSVGAVSYGSATPFRVISDLLRRVFQIEDADDPPQVHEKVTATLRAHQLDMELDLPPLLTLLDMTADSEAWRGLDSRQRRQRALAAVKRLILVESRRQPLLLVVEDLHWIDAESQAVLDTLVEGLPAGPILLVVNYRPEYRHDWSGKAHYTLVRIDPLPPDGADALLRSLLGADASLAPVTRRLLERTGGNPFFLEESVRALVETQALIGERGGYRLTRALDTIDVPPSIDAVLAARIERLPEDAKALLRWAAVIGTHVPAALLEAVAEGHAATLGRGLAHLKAAEFLYETRVVPDPEYTFKHALTHDVAYGRVPPDERRTLHARIVAAIQALYRDRLAEHVEQLAHHAVRGELWEQAVAYSRDAGAKAASRSAHREAVAFIEQALAALSHLPDIRRTVEHGIDLRFELRNSLVPLGELARIRCAIDEADALATALHDRRRLGWVSGYMAHVNWITGDQERAVESGRRALSHATEVRDFDLEVLANFYVGVAYHAMSEYGQAIPFFERTVASLVGDLVHKPFGLVALPSVLSRGLLVWCLAEQGRFAEGIEPGRQALQIAQESDRSYTLISACFAVGFGHLRRGELEPAIAVLERALRLVHDRDVPVLAPWAASSLGYAYALSGRAAEAVALLTEAVERNLSMNSPILDAVWLSWLSEAHLLAGRLDDARECAGRALEISRDRKEPGHEAHVLRVLAEIAAHPDAPDLETAERQFRQAMDMATRLGMRPLVAHCHRGLAGLYRRLGSDDQSRAHLANATAMYREMAMELWLTQLLDTTAS